MMIDPMQDDFRTYLFSYQHAGASWVLELKAASAEDAQARLRKLHTATFDGELVMKLTVPDLGLRRVGLTLRRWLFGH